MLDPFITASPLIQFHLLCAIPAVVLGPLALFRQRRDRLHKTTGYIWLLSILGLALSGLAIPSQIPLVLHMGPIHVLCVYALWGVFDGLRAIYRRDIAKHQRTMRALWFGATGVTALLAFAPGRMLHMMVFGAVTPAVWVLLAGSVAALWWFWRSYRARAA